MAEERSKSDFCDILNRIDRRFEIIHVKWAESKFFEIKFRTQIPRDNEDFNALCDEWVDLFSDVTNTVWAKKISNTGPKIRFRKQYQCWTQGGKVIQKELLFDAKRCKGTLDMKVLTDNPLTRRKNKHIKLGLNVVVKINFTHLHQMDRTQPFSFFVHTCAPQAEAPKPVIQVNARLPQVIAEIVQKASSKTASTDLSKHNTEKIIQKHYNTNSRSINIARSCGYLNNINDMLATSSANLVVSNANAVNNNNSIITSISNLIPTNKIDVDIVTNTTGLLDPNSVMVNNNTIVTQDLLQGSLLQAEIELKSSGGNIIVSDNQQHLLQDSLQVSGIQQQSIQLIPNVSLQSLDTVKLDIQPQVQQYTQVVVSSQLELGEPLLMCQPLMFDTSQVIPVAAHSLPSHFVVHPQNIHNQAGPFL